MTTQSYTTFKGATNWQKDGLNQNILYGILSWSRWAMLEIGGFENVEKSQNDGLYGGHPSILRKVDDPNYDDGQIWEAIRDDWVWESGVSYAVEPIVASGVYVDDSFKPTATEVGAYAHHIDYPNGRVVFDTAIDTTSDVRCDYSFRIPTIDYAKKKDFQELLYGSLSVERSDFNVETGSHNQLAQSRVTMPAVGIELSKRVKYKPYQLGSGQWVYQDVLFHVLSENKAHRDSLVDLFCNQNDKVIWLPNVSDIKESVNYPIDIDVKGSPVANPMQYEDIVGESGFRWARVRLINTQADSLQFINDWLYLGTVRTTCEIIIENI